MLCFSKLKSFLYRQPGMRYFLLNYTPNLIYAIVNETINLSSVLTPCIGAKLVYWVCGRPNAAFHSISVYKAISCCVEQRSILLMCPLLPNWLSTLNLNEETDTRNRWGTFFTLVSHKSYFKWNVWNVSSWLYRIYF